MHYFRLLRPPKLLYTGKSPHVQLIFTIATDLGDSFLYPDEPIELAMTYFATSASGTSPCPLSTSGKMVWEPGMRVAKPSIAISKEVQSAIEAGDNVQICISTGDPVYSADAVDNILAISSKTAKKEANERGLVMPAWAPLHQYNKDVDVYTRRLQFSSGSNSADYVEIEEEIGESIARHIWDAGVVSLCALAATHEYPDEASSRHGCMQAMRDIFNRQAPIGVLELGCGVGILGVGLGTMYPKLRPRGDCTILMTDLDEAESRARANIARLKSRQEVSDSAGARVLYENLDWEEGRRGGFGPEVKSRPWDLVMLSDCTYNVDVLPALVGTLSAIHSSNLTHVAARAEFSTKVFLATKPRHASERALFALMAEEGWRTLHRQVLPLHVLGSEPESVELYMFEKR